jgi:hypothetical protein
MPLILLGAAALLGGTGFLSGFSLSNKLGTALTVAGSVLGLFLGFMLLQKMRGK